MTVVNLNKYSVQVNRAGQWLEVTTVATKELAELLVKEYSKDLPTHKFKIIERY